MLDALLAQPTLRRRLARAAGQDDLDPVHVVRLAHLAFLHDLGKCCRGFRAKAEPGAVRTCGHIRALRPLFASELQGRFADLAVPLRSAAVQLHAPLQSWLDRTFVDQGFEALLAVPGYLRMGRGDLLPLRSLA